MKSLDYCFSLEGCRELIIRDIESIRKEYNLPALIDSFDSADYIVMSNKIREYSISNTNYDREQQLRDYRHRIIAKYITPPCNTLSFRKGVIK